MPKQSAVKEKLEDYYINCDIDDCLTSRGPLLLKISHPLFKYNVIANSFQERNNQLEDVRKLQINQLSLNDPNKKPNQIKIRNILRILS